MMTEVHYDYQRYESEFREAIKRLIGQTLVSLRFQCVPPEFNVAYLQLQDTSVAIQGNIGGEVLQVVYDVKLPTLGKESDLSYVLELPEARKFLGCKIAQARVVGESWNGHGVEFGFEGIAESTLLITSVECEENNLDRHDALRVAITEYKITFSENGA